MERGGGGGEGVGGGGRGDQVSVVSVYEIGLSR